MLFNRTFHPSHFLRLSPGIVGQDVDIILLPNGTNGEPDGDVPTAMPKAAADGISGTDLRIWIGRHNDNSLLVAFRPGGTAGPEETFRVRVWYHK